MERETEMFDYLDSVSRTPGTLLLLWGTHTYTHTPAILKMSKFCVFFPVHFLRIQKMCLCALEERRAWLSLHLWAVFAFMKLYYRLSTCTSSM